MTGKNTLIISSPENHPAVSGQCGKPRDPSTTTKRHSLKGRIKSSFSSDVTACMENLKNENKENLYVLAIHKTSMCDMYNTMYIVITFI